MLEGKKIYKQGGHRMEIITKQIQVYNFKELSEIAQNKVINDYIQFILECIPYEEMTDNMKKAIDKSNNMQTPWFTPLYVYEYCLDEIMEGIECYTYTNDGNIFIE